ncbi:Tfp pilus assembly protein FimT/FimU [Pseudoxanthomonas sp. SGT-18]|uniref:GspH/FimT family pseudopilin n=1 Tax=Pseudoxanthomonas sp. SGT-18 TaxID=2493087 RepID=UPI000F62B538|nr:Tfp pilus assembly protein FimT/FimU [Pseudoxanthomonas sp. SGT-18]
MPSCRNSGFTLMELMVTLAVLAILLAVGLPSFQGSLRSNRLATTTNELIASMSLARSEAIRNGRGSGVCASADGASCGDDWAAGWLVWQDANGNGNLDAGEAVLRFSQGNAKIAASATADVIAFDSRGRRRAANDQSIGLQPTDCPGGDLRRTVTVNTTGQIKTTKGACS